MSNIAFYSSSSLTTSDLHFQVLNRVWRYRRNFLPSNIWDTFFLRVLVPRMWTTSTNGLWRLPSCDPHQRAHDKVVLKGWLGNCLLSRAALLASDDFVLKFVSVTFRIIVHKLCIWDSSINPPYNNVSRDPVRRPSALSTWSFIHWLTDWLTARRFFFCWFRLLLYNSALHFFGCHWTTQMYFFSVKFGAHCLGSTPMKCAVSYCVYLSFYWRQ